MRTHANSLRGPACDTLRELTPAICRWNWFQVKDPTGRCQVDVASGHSTVSYSGAKKITRSFLYKKVKCLPSLKGTSLHLESSLVRTAVVLLIAWQDEAFFSVVQAKTNIESGL